MEGGGAGHGAREERGRADRWEEGKERWRREKGKHACERVVKR